MANESIHRKSIPKSTLDAVRIAWRQSLDFQIALGILTLVSLQPTEAARYRAYLEELFAMDHFQNLAAGPDLDLKPAPTMADLLGLSGVERARLDQTGWWHSNEIRVVPGGKTLHVLQRLNEHWVASYTILFTDAGVASVQGSQLRPANYRGNHQGDNWGPSLDSATIRQLRPADAIAYATRSLLIQRKLAQVLSHDQLADLGFRKVSLTLPRVSGNRTGRRPLTDSHMVTVAQTYLALQNDGGHRRLNVRLADEMNVAVSTARDWIAECRSRGFLGPARKGVAGATPGPNLPTD